MSAAYTNNRLQEMVTELDSFVGNNSCTDWELDFVVDMVDRKSFSFGQKEHILRLWEKYCA